MSISHLVSFLRSGRTRSVDPRESERDEVLATLPKRSRGAEIGVHKGNFSARLLETLEPVELHLIDPWRYESEEIYKDAWYGGQAGGEQQEMDERHANVCRRFSAEIRRGQVNVHRATSEEALQSFPDGYFDWMYIDGNHLYEFVKTDLQLSLQKTKAGGLIAGDDYVEGGWWKGGVRKAVDEFLAEAPVTLVSARDSQYILRKATA